MVSMVMMLSNDYMQRKQRDEVNGEDNVSLTEGSRRLRVE